MGANVFGTHFKIITFGESHGPAMGVVVEGCPAGVSFSWDLLQEKMDRRRPGQFSWVSDRKELDVPQLLSGVFRNRTLGTPIALLIENKNFKPEDYNFIKNSPRPGHADDVWKEKFGHIDYRGGGRASGRETTGRVLGGAIAQMFLQELYSHLSIKAIPIQIGPFIRDNLTLYSEEGWFGRQSKEVEQFLTQKKSEGRSYGGTIRVEVDKPPAGLGQPVFRKLKSELAAAFMSIGACYEVSLGDYYLIVSEKENDIKSPQWNISFKEGSQLHGKKDNSIYGGIRGGISTGEKIVFHLKFKPPASVLDIAKQGRHDPCIVPRATVVVESMAWLVMADHVLWSRQDRL